MDLGTTNIADTYKFLLNQSGSSITLGNGTAIDWSSTDLVNKTGNQTVAGLKTFTSILSITKPNSTSNDPEAYLSNGLYYTKINSRSNTASNPLITDGDHSIIFGDDAINSVNANLVIGPYSNTARGIKINHLGNIGIGTSPTEKLHVNGTIKANAFTGTTFTGDTFNGTVFSGKSFISDSFGLKNYNIKLLANYLTTGSTTWNDIPSMSQTLSSGSWLANCSAVYSGTNVASIGGLRLTNGFVNYSATLESHAALAGYNNLNLSTIINLTANTLVKLQAYSTLANSNFMFTGVGGGTNHATQLSFVKIS